MARAIVRSRGRKMKSADAAPRISMNRLPGLVARARPP